MPSIGPGVIEIRLHSETEHRVFYVAKFAESVYVLHAFEKKTQKTSQADIDLGRENLKELRKWRREQELWQRRAPLCGSHPGMFLVTLASTQMRLSISAFVRR
jgi:hypothetical protein